jgi:hypothetical protein
MQYGFCNGDYQKVIVTWSCDSDVREIAAQNNIDIWEFPNILREITEKVQGESTYFADDTIRTLHLFSLAQLKP